MSTRNLRHATFTPDFGRHPGQKSIWTAIENIQTIQHNTGNFDWSTWIENVQIETPPVTTGYWMESNEGDVYGYGTAVNYGSLSCVIRVDPCAFNGNTLPTANSVVGFAAMPNDAGYWEVGSDGGVFTFPKTPPAYFGSINQVNPLLLPGGSNSLAPLVAPIVGMASTADGQGYYLVAADGGIFTFGDAVFYGSIGGHVLNEPVVGMAMTPDGKGYWEVAKDGGIFNWGDATFLGSTGGDGVTNVVGMAVRLKASSISGPGGQTQEVITAIGYWLVTSSGQVYGLPNGTFGSCAGSGQPCAALPTGDSIAGISGTADGGGYYIVDSGGHVSIFGDAVSYNDESQSTLPPRTSVVGIESE